MQSKLHALLKRRPYLIACIAVLVSVLIHLVILANLHMHWPTEDDEDTETITATLDMPPAPAKSTPSQPIGIPIKPHHTPPKSINPQATENPPSDETPQPATTPVQPNIADATSSSNTEATTSSTAEPVDTKPDNTVPNPPADQTTSQPTNSQASVVIPDDLPVTPPPKKVTIEYDLNSGADTTLIGKTILRYEATSDGHYKLSNITDPKGLAALFLKQWVQVSEGLVSDKGLQPNDFTYQFGDNPNKTRHAHFDWQARQLTMEAGKNTHTEPLVDGTQDMQSFMLQFMFVPPLTQMDIHISNGKKVGLIHYSFEGEEALNTKLGAIDTLHISKSRGDSEEKTELWLAPDYHHLPVKIRKTEKDGKVYEQTVTRLQAE